MRQQPLRSINRLVQLLNRVCIIPAAERQRLIGKLSELPNCYHQIVESNLPLLDSFPHAVLNDPSLKINRLPCGGRELHPCRVFEHPSQPKVDLA